MGKSYTKSLLVSILKVFRCHISQHYKRGLLFVIVSPFMSVRSLKDAAETCGVKTDYLYKAVNELDSFALLSNIQIEGQKRLIKHLRRLKNADSSVKSRECVTICADDFTRKVRGDMGGLAHPCYSGADKKVVYGLNTDALAVVIGENKDNILLDLRVVPAKNVGFGPPGQTHIKWLQAALERLSAEVKSYGLSLENCYLSVDSAYASGALFNFATKVLKLKLVSEIKSSYIVWSWFWTPIPAGIYFGWFEFIFQNKFVPLNAERKVMHLRHIIKTRVYGEILVVPMQIDGEIKRYFASGPEMKAITIRRIAKRRWQLERIFWNMKQLLGFNLIHQQTQERVFVRIYIVFLLTQATTDCAKGLKITVNKLHLVLRRDTNALISGVDELITGMKSQSGKSTLDGEQPQKNNMS